MGVGYGCPPPPHQKRDRHDQEDRQQDGKRREYNASRIIDRADGGSCCADGDGVENWTGRQLGEMNTQGESNTGGDGNPLVRFEERRRIGHRQRFGCRTGAESEPSSGWADYRLNPIVDAVDDRDLVCHELDHEKEAQDSEHPFVLQPQPRLWELDEIEETTRQPQRQKWDVGIQPGGQREACSGEKLQHWLVPPAERDSNMGRVYLIGLTGGIASGKTVVAKRLAEHGAVHIDADQLARQVVDPGTPALAQIAAEFGPSVISPNGSLDRAALGSIIFTDPERRARLNGIMHPAVKKLARQLMDEADARDPQAVVVYDVPLLVEAAVDRNYRAYDLIVVVNASTATRIDRLVRLRGLNREEAAHRLNSQASDTERLAIADVVIDSNGTLQHTLDQTDQLWQRIAVRPSQVG